MHSGVAVLPVGCLRHRVKRRRVPTAVNDGLLTQPAQHRQLRPTQAGSWGTIALLALITLLDLTTLLALLLLRHHYIFFFAQVRDEGGG